MIYGNLTSPEIDRIASDAIALIPLAAVEQHGRHLPVVTDTTLVTEVAHRAELQLSKEVVLLPTLWIGSSHHHLGFPGTVSIKSDTYILVVKDIVDCLLTSGFRRVILLNGHGGNIGPVNEALYRISLEHTELDAPWVVCATYWKLAEAELRERAFMETPNLTHACEYETSMMLSLRTDWVHMEKAQGGKTQRHSRFYDPMGHTALKVSVAEVFKQMTDTGASGSPEIATKEKGEKHYHVDLGGVLDRLLQMENPARTLADQRLPLAGELVQANPRNKG